MQSRKMLSQLCLIFLSVFCLPTLLASGGTVEATEFNGLPAYRLSDGKTEAVVVPALSGRVMRYGTVGGLNWMWNAPVEKLQGDGYKNHGGDKTFAGPHSVWETFGPIWPPDASWDGAPHQAQVLAEGRLKTTGNIWRGFGVRVIREFSFNASGEFVITHTLEKVEGEPRQLAIWPVTQTISADAVIIPLKVNSAYARSFHSFGDLPASAKMEVLPEAVLENGRRSEMKLLKVTPTAETAYKIGADSPLAAIAAIKGNLVFLQRGEELQGQYPDGGEGAGLPVEFYSHGESGSAHFVELELLSPLVCLRAGESITFTTRWSVHPLPEAPHQHLPAVERLFVESPVVP